MKNSLLAEAYHILHPPHIAGWPAILPQIKKSERITLWQLFIF
ncbi:MAG: hypothetical protein K0R92_812 [Lachnospiraceae bacterium]|jgi:hypothetical protein|nr:hypothetical protein [Lachnospiraceae bacterium]